MCGGAAPRGGGELLSTARSPAPISSLALRELRRLAGVVPVEVADPNILDLIRLYADLGELVGNRPVELGHRMGIAEPTL